MEEKEIQTNRKNDETDPYLEAYAILDRRHVHDEELLDSRTGNFLLVHSFLLVAFATLIVNEVWFSYFFPIVGIVMCVVFYPLFWMQLKTARLWLKIEDQMEPEMSRRKLFPAVGEGEKGQTKLVTTAPNQRHKEMTGKNQWMWPAWIAGPLMLVAAVLGLWIALLIIA